MRTISIVWFLGILGVFIGAFQVIALKFYFYWTIWWFDILMHFLGGLWIGLIVLWFYKAFMGDKARSDHGYLLALVGVMVVGILWEIFEVLAGLTKGQDDYLFDTVLDLIMDTVGAVAAAYIVFRQGLHKLTNKENV